ncbi:MAG: hypothetical protein WA020_13375, partial [Candidatus Acidiferrales bacterium]
AQIAAEGTGRFQGNQGFLGRKPLTDVTFGQAIRMDRANRGAHAVGSRESDANMLREKRLR